MEADTSICTTDNKNDNTNISQREIIHNNHQRLNYLQNDDYASSSTCSSQNDGLADLPTNEMTPLVTRSQSSSYFKPRTIECYEEYLRPMNIEGYLEKRSKEKKNVWKKRWFVMEDGILYYYKNKELSEESKENLSPKQRIHLDTVVSVQTAVYSLIDLALYFVELNTKYLYKRDSNTAFRINLKDRNYILRAESKDKMHDWLFEFQRSIASIITVIIRSKSEEMSEASCSVHPFLRKYKAGHRSSSMEIERKKSSLASNLVYSSDVCLSSDEEERSKRSFYDNDLYTRKRRFSAPFTAEMYSQRNRTSNSSIYNRSNLKTQESSIFEETIEKESENLVFRNESSLSHDEIKKEIDIHNKNTSKFDQPRSEGRWIPPHQRKSHQKSLMLGDDTKKLAKETPLGLMFDLNLEDETDLLPCKIAEKDHTYRKYGITSIAGIREKMEDVCCCIPNIQSHCFQNENDFSDNPEDEIYAVFDGHCGRKAAEYFNENLMTVLINDTSYKDNIKESLYNCFGKIDEEFLRLAANEDLYDGTTAAIVFKRSGELITANAGDSRAVLCLDGRAVDIMDVQNPGREDEKARIIERGGYVTEEKELNMVKLHQMDLSDPYVINIKAKKIVKWVTIYRINGELAVSRAIGDIDYKKNNNYLVIPDPEIKQIALTENANFFILACDGLWDTVESQEAVDHVNEILNKGGSPQDASNFLAKLALKYGSSDNISVIVVLLTWKQPK